MSGPASIEQFTLSLLTYKGALVEPSPGAAGALLGTELALALGMNEYERLVFDPSLDAAGAVRVDYDSVAFEAMGRFVDTMGSLAFVRLAEPPLKTIDPQKELERALNLQNGIFRLRDCAAANPIYFCFCIQYDVMADERQGGVAEVWVNPATRSVPRLPLLLDTVDHYDDVAELDLGALSSQAWDLAVPAASSSIRLRLREFIESLKRRRERDLRRMQDYYGSIDEEIRKKIARAGSKDSVRSAELERLQATAQAYRARAAELCERYRARVRATGIAALACAIPAYQITVQLMRRSAKRDAVFSWNPFDRKIEPACCDGCRRPVDRAALCDDRVHYLCLNCLGPCSSCSRIYCRACHSRCPRFSHH